jgi:very-short-patch-repair endonuclease
MVDHMREPLLSGAELRADPQLREVAKRNGWTVFPHVKLSDVIDERPEGIDADTWSYATRAHFDFLVVDLETRPVFAVEIDGLSHADPGTQQRDRKKDRLVEKSGFELLRVGVGHLDTGPRGRRLIEYLIDARQFIEAAWASGYGESDPYFDPDYRNIIGRGEDGRLSFVNHLSELARRRALSLRQRRVIPGGVIETLHFSWRSGWSEAWAWLRVKDDLWLFEKAQVRDFGRFLCGIAPFELAEDLAARAMGDALQRFLAGDPAAVRPREMQRDLDAILTQRDLIEDTIHLDHCRFA